MDTIIVQNMKSIQFYINCKYEVYTMICLTNINILKLKINTIIQMTITNKSYTLYTGPQ